MKKALVIASVMALSALPLSAKLPSHPESIKPLFSHDAAICTTWSINARKGLWMTAGHCVLSTIETEEGELVKIPTPDLNIDKLVAVVIKLDTHNDLAMLQADVHERGLRLGSYPHVGDEVNAYGYPGGLLAPLPTWLHVSNPFMTAWGRGWMVLDGAIWPGHSGSPVLDRKGKVIAVFQAHGTERFTGLSLASPWDILRGFVADMWE